MLKLVQVDNGQFDLAFDDPAKGDVDAAIETVVVAALFTDAEAPAARVDDRYDRRGWWANPDAGSGLWHLRRQPLHSAARREALVLVEGALLDHGLASVTVTEQSSVGSVSGVFMQITGSHNGRDFAMSIPL
ncbi:MAG: baseplate assembly protein [Methylomonas sp.]|nr:MAG: baseplate assembly protein [Methylomonas sp.]